MRQIRYCYNFYFYYDRSVSVPSLIVLCVDVTVETYEVVYHFQVPRTHSIVETRNSQTTNYPIATKLKQKNTRRYKNNHFKTMKEKIHDDKDNHFESAKQVSCYETNFFDALF